jgi:hypothetical protein
MENLLATPVRPLEVMLGKIVPYIVVGYVQVVVILTAAKFLFQVPMLGSLLLLSTILILFIATNLAIGFTFSTLAKSQMQAMQMTMFFFLPSMLLSGSCSRSAACPVGAGPRRDLPAHPLPEDRARHHAQGQRIRRPGPERVAARGDPPGGLGDGVDEVPADPRLGRPTCTILRP